MLYYGIGQSPPMTDEGKKKTLMIQAVFWGIVLVAAAGALPFSPSPKEKILFEEEDEL